MVWREHTALVMVSSLQLILYMLSWSWFTHLESAIDDLFLCALRARVHIKKKGYKHLNALLQGHGKMHWFLVYFMWCIVLVVVSWLQGSISPLACTLYYLSNEGQLRKATNAFGLCRQIVSKIIWEVWKGITVHPEYIRLLFTEPRVLHLVGKFHSAHKIPQSIDGIYQANICWFFWLPNQKTQILIWPTNFCQKLLLYGCCCQIEDSLRTACTDNRWKWISACRCRTRTQKNDQRMECWWS